MNLWQAVFISQKLDFSKESFSQSSERWKSKPWLKTFMVLSYSSFLLHRSQNRTVRLFKVECMLSHMEQNLSISAHYWHFGPDNPSLLGVVLCYICRIFSSIPNHYPLMPLVTTKSVSKHCHPWLRTTAMKYWKGKWTQVLQNKL